MLARFAACVVSNVAALLSTRARSVATLVRVAARFVLDCVVVSVLRSPSRVVIPADFVAPGKFAAFALHVRSLVVEHAVSVTWVLASQVVQVVQLDEPENREYSPAVYMQIAGSAMPVHVAAWPSSTTASQAVTSAELPVLIAAHVSTAHSVQDPTEPA